MNIFYVDKNPILAARYLCDKHVVKMVLETTQLLCSNNTVFQPYKPTHINHPCAKWAFLCIANYNWLTSHGLELCKEYTFRYGKIHKCQQYLEKLATQHQSLAPDYFVQFTEPPQCMPDECKIWHDTVMAYRNYYNQIKSVTIKCKWTKRVIPDWFIYNKI